MSVTYLHTRSVSAALALAAILLLGAGAFAQEPDPGPGDIQLIRFRHIYVAPGDTPEAQKAQRGKIGKALDELKAGAAFEDVAAKYSEVSEESRTRWVTVEPGKVNPEIERQVLALEEGAFSDIFETKHGYQIVYLMELIRPIPTPVPQPTPTPMFEKRLSARAFSTYAFRPENSSTPYTIEDGFLWSTKKDAVFYAEIPIPAFVEVVGFNVWVRDTGGEERPNAELWEFVGDNSSTQNRIAERESDGPWPEGEMSMCHFPGIKHITHQTYGNSLYAKVTLRSGDRTQAIHGGLVIFLFDSVEGDTLREDAARYIAKEQQHPGLCPLCLGREREQRKAWLRAMGEEIPNPQKSRLNETYPELLGQKSMMQSVLHEPVEE